MLIRRVIALALILSLCSLPILAQNGNADMLSRIRSNWVQQQQAAGTVLMKFTILRNGQVVSIETERPSNITSLDLASQRALYTTARVAPLPAGFPDDHLTVHLNFEYVRQ